MSITFGPTQDEVFTAIRSFLQYALPDLGENIVQGQDNRVPELKAENYVIMWPLFAPRLATNANDYTDCVFTASIATTVLTVTAVNSSFTGRIGVGSTIFGTGVATGTKVTSLGTGTGGVGTYNINTLQTVASRAMAAGTQTLLQSVDFVVQIDAHGPEAQNNALTVSTLFFDAVACDKFVESGVDMAPLYIDNPRQMPFVNGEQQVEDRYTLTSHFQVNQTLIIPQQYADAITITLIDADKVGA